jgi:toxin HigB-1
MCKENNDTQAQSRKAPTQSIKEWLAHCKQVICISLFRITGQFRLHSVPHYGTMPFMILSFGCRETEKLWRGERSRKFPPDIQQRALDKLAYVNAAADINDLRIPPSNHLEKLHGNREGQYSIRINKQWRVCFIWLDGKAEGVEIIDYH